MYTPHATLNNKPTLPLYSIFLSNKLKFHPVRVNDFLRHMHYRVWVSFINGAQNSINFKSISILSVSKQCSNNSRGRLSPSHIQYGILFALLTIQYLSGLRESSGLI